MTDIVERLRNHADGDSDLMLAAAAEIERLREKLIEADASARRCWNAYHRERKGES